MPQTLFKLCDGTVFNQTKKMNSNPTVFYYNNLEPGQRTYEIKFVYGVLLITRK